MTKPLLQTIAYVRLPARDVEASARFAADLCGLERSVVSGEDAAFRADERYQSLVFLKDRNAMGTVGIELYDEDAFTRAEAVLRDAGAEVAVADAEACAARAVRRALLTRDPSGNPVDLVLGPRLTARRFFPTRDCGVRGLQGAGLRSTNIATDVAFWTDLLGARVADRIGDITYIGMDESHHRLVLYPAAHSGLFSLVMEVESLDLLMQNYYLMLERQVRIHQGPGRDVASGQAFMHFAGPDDVVFTLATGVPRADGARRPRQFERSRETLCAWGSECLDLPELAADGPSIHVQRRAP